METATLASKRFPVLIVDDNAFVKTFYEKALKEFPLEFFPASDGEEAVRMAAETHPALVLMDINMPRLDGVAATRRIRATPGLEHTVVIAVSARMKDAYTGSAEFTEYLMKPLPIEKLRAMVRKYLNL